MKRLLSYLFWASSALAVCFCFGWLAWKANYRYELSKFELAITGKVEIFENYNPHDQANPVIAVVDKGEMKILDVYWESDFGGIEVEMPDGRKGYIHFFRPEQNYEIIKKED